MLMKLFLAVCLLLSVVHVTYYLPILFSCTTMHKDLLIIGGGLAGLTAALEASVRMPHWKILIVEKTSQLGGNSAKASSGVNAALNTADVAAFTQDTLASGGGVSNPQLVQLLTSQSQAGKSFLMEETQVELNIISQLGGHSAARTFRNEKGPNVGRVLIQHLQKRLLQQQEQVQVQLDTSVSRLVVNQSKMAAVAMVKKGETKEELIETDRVILATGGFSSSVDLLRKHVPAIADFPTTNGDWATGDGLQLTEAVGASFVHLDQVQLHPTGFVDPKNPTAKQLFLAPEAIRGSGALLVNQHGERFVNELEKRDVVSQAILRQPTKEAFLILFQQGAQLFGTGKLNFYVMKGLAKHVNGTLTELAATYQFEYDTLARTLTEYNSGTDPFGKTIFPSTIPKFSPESNLNEMCFEAFVMRVRPVVHYCMGGVQIDQHARVLSKKQTVIDGLYAAGEVTGGVHGKNRLGGNSLAECIVFGRIAAQHAVHYSPNN